MKTGFHCKFFLVKQRVNFDEIIRRRLVKLQIHSVQRLEETRGNNNNKDCIIIIYDIFYLNMQKCIVALVCFIGFSIFNPQAKAEIISISGFQSLPFSTAQAGSGTVVIDFDGNSTFIFANYNGSNIDWAIPGGGGDGFSLLANPGFSWSSTSLSLGSGIDSSLSYTQSVNTGSNTPIADTFYALRYQNGGGYNYGWAELSFNGNDTTLVNAALNTTVDQPINASQVPEPSSQALLGLSVLALMMAYRRKPSQADPR